jgi:hypothetical protein
MIEKAKAAGAVVMALVVFGTALAGLTAAGWWLNRKELRR